MYSLCIGPVLKLWPKVHEEMVLPETKSSHKGTFKPDEVTSKSNLASTIIYTPNSSSILMFNILEKVHAWQKHF